MITQQLALHFELKTPTVNRNYKSGTTDLHTQHAEPFDVVYTIDMTGKKINLQLFKGLLVSPFLLYIMHAATHDRLACDHSTVARYLKGCL